MLTHLELRHGEALEAMLCDFDPNPDELHGYFCERDWPIDRVVDELAAWARGERLTDGWVPCTTWFWEADDALQGVINVRHSLTPGLREIGGNIGYSVAPAHRGRGVATAMLGAVLPECQRLGIERALLTADSDNEHSWRVIEHHRGVLEREAIARDGALQRWYWIDLSA